MAKSYAKAFYNSSRWQHTSKAYMTSKHWLCERCGSPASICHHRQWLNPETIRDPAISLAWENLECLCQDCHNREHATREGACVFSSDGRVIGTRENAELREFKEAVEAINEIEKCAV
ncbi:MAG: HNH endonuclease [Desulfovibrio sp.]|nr:HNH endonuclease [Desulfovibrio sp.]